MYPFALLLTDINEERAYHGQAKLRRQIIMPQLDRGMSSISSLTPNDFIPVLCAKKPSIKVFKDPAVAAAGSNTISETLPQQQAVPQLSVPIPSHEPPTLPTAAASNEDGHISDSDSGSDSELDPEEEEERALEIPRGAVLNENINPPLSQQQRQQQPQQQQQRQRQQQSQQQQQPQPQQQRQQQSQQQQQHQPQQQKRKRKAVSKPPKTNREKRQKPADDAANAYIQSLVIAE